MAQDLKKLFGIREMEQTESLPKGHETRFLKRLDEAFPEPSKKHIFNWRVAASVALFIGLGFTTFKYMSPTKKGSAEIANTEDLTKKETLKSLGDVSPDLKKIEDYYLANINLELSKVKITKENKDLFDGYVFRLAELNKEYKTLSVELTENGPNELMVSALIDNLKLRLNLLYRLKEQLTELNASEGNSLSKNVS